MQVHFQPGDWVEVKPFADILATLDAQGCCEGIPFMREMAAYCERQFRVYRRAEKVFVDKRHAVLRLRHTVFLEGVRCNGQSHDGCQMGCLMFWKEAWLRPAVADEAICDRMAPSRNVIADFPTRQGNRYCCQATALMDGTSLVPWWDFRQYLRDYSARKMSVREWAGMLALLANNKLRRACGLDEHDPIVGRLEKTVHSSLDLQPGEWVQVKSRKEIEATLDAFGKNCGLAFATEMARCCGGTYRVAKRVEQIILEWSGEMRPIANTVALEDVTCDGIAHRGCPRDCYHLWREIWLRRVDPSALPPPADPSA